MILIWNQQIQLEEPFFWNVVKQCLQLLINDILKIFFNFLNENIFYFAKQFISQIFFCSENHTRFSNELFGKINLSQIRWVTIWL